MISRVPLPPLDIERKIVKCANIFCHKDLNKVKNSIVYRGYGYCSKNCKKEWPPIIHRIQTTYQASIYTILEIALKLFKSKRRTADVLEISPSTLDKLYERFKIILRKS